MRAPANDDVIYEFALEVPRGKVITYDLAKLASALGVDDPTRLVVETDGGRHALVTVYPANPLAEVRAVTREDLIMDRAGYIVIGSYHNGRPAKRRLYDPSTGSAQRFLSFGTTGAGKSRSVQLELIAEKLNGIVSWLADLKEGASVPEARRHVDWHVTSLLATLLMLEAAVAVARERMVRYSRMGRTAFVLGQPDPLLHVTVDEANRLLAKGSPYREYAAWLLLELSRAGRSVGVGVRMAAQAAHLDELGGSDTLRAMLKEGEVTLLRWSGSMMRQLVADGLLPPGIQLMPIPKTLRPIRLTSQFDLYEDEDDAPGTQGMGYLLSSPHPASVMRHHRIGSIAPLPGLDPEILALYGSGDPHRLEEASHAAAGPAYFWRNDAAAMEGLCQEMATRFEPGGSSNGNSTASSTAPAGAPDTVPPPAPVLLADRVLTVLRTATEPLDGPAILQTVNAALTTDGGKTVSLGSVRNVLRGLVDDGTATQPAHGLYALADDHAPAPA